MPSLPYHEPDRITVLVQFSFLFLLNAVESVLNRALYCGLLGQVLLGIAFGAPGGSFLSHEAQQVMVQIGYLGLILLVYEGGLSVPLKSLKANIYLSTAVACTGIAVPIALSFVLQPLMHATSLQAFAAGAALCSTSLGTTFTVLSTSGLINTRIGSVLSTAAMMDDVIGLVMVQVISNLGSAATSLDPVVVVRPILVSLAFTILVPAILRYIIRPIRTAHSSKQQLGRFLAIVKRGFEHAEVRFVSHCLLLYGMIAAAAWSGTSVLFTAYLTGAIINWWDTEEESTSNSPQQQNQNEDATPKPASNTAPTVGQQEPNLASLDGIRSRSSPVKDLSGQVLYHKSLEQPVNRVLRPLFFASIGFSIPISSLFTGPLLWRGLVYAILMVFAKLVCGIWLMPRSSKNATAGATSMTTRITKQMQLLYSLLKRTMRKAGDQPSTYMRPTSTDSAGAIELDTVNTISRTGEVQPAISHRSPSSNTQNQTTDQNHQERREQATYSTDPEDSVPLSLYPSAMLGFAMVSRGEIGFLISAVAESAGIWRPSNANLAEGADINASSDIFIVVTWAIVLCTFAGPVAVGLVVNRVKRLEQGSQSPGRNVLGSWGVEVK